MKKILKVMIVAIMIFGIVGLTGCNKNSKNDKLTIISTSFPGYDFARAVTKDSKDVINGTYIVEDSHVIITSSDKTYKFKINDNDTLSYMNGLADVELNKVDASELKYIK